MDNTGFDVQQEARGLTGADAEKRLREVGPNQLFKPHTVGFLDIIREETTEPMILLLFAVGFFYAIGRELGDAIDIFSIIAGLIFAEVWNEYRAKKTIISLSKLAAPTAKVMRDGASINIQAERVVPGDLLLLTSGREVAADGRVRVLLGLQVDESACLASHSPRKKLGDEICMGRGQHLTRVRLNLLPQPQYLRQGLRDEARLIFRVVI